MKKPASSAHFNALLQSMGLSRIGQLGVRCSERWAIAHQPRPTVHQPGGIGYGARKRVRMSPSPNNILTALGVEYRTGL